MKYENVETILEMESRKKWNNTQQLYMKEEK